MGSEMCIRDRSRKVSSFEDLKNLVLLEEFRDSLPRSIRVHLDDLEITDAKTAARKADEYSVSHRWAEQSGQPRAHGHKGDLNAGQNGANSGQSHERSKGPWCTIHGYSGHSTSECRRLKANPSHPTQQHTQQKSPNPVLATNSQPVSTRGRTRNAGKSSGDRAPPQTRPVSLCVTSSITCLLYTSPSPRDGLLSRMPSSA